MKERYADLCILKPDGSVIEMAEKLGWDAICLAGEFKDTQSFKKFAEEAEKLKKGGAELYVGAVISDNIAEKARKAVECADLIIAEGKNEEACRQAAESHEVDLLLSPEGYVENDLTDYRNSGLDHVTMKSMADRKTAYGIRFADILNSYGSRRIQLLGRIRQNIQLALKYKTPVIAVSGASSEYELRAPREIIAYLSYLGLGDAAKKTVTENPLKLIKKIKDRSNPNVITEGVGVVEWGGQQKKPKKKSGWY